MSFIKLKWRRCSLSLLPPLSVCLPSLISSAFFFMREGSAIAAPSVRLLAGEMDVSVSQSRLISARCSVYFRLFRGVLAGKVHRCSFYFNSQICLGKVELRSFCFAVFQQSLFVLFFWSGTLGCWPTCQFAIQHSKE